MRSELAEIWTGTIHWDVAMADYCTFQTGGNVDALLAVSTREELVTLIKWLDENEVAWRVIGRGSNILVQSQGFKGVVLILGGEFNAVEAMNAPENPEQKIRIRVGAGCSVGRLVGWCCQNEVSGTEFLVGIPGSVGGAVHMNAGAWGKEIGEYIESVTFISRAGEIVEMSRDDLEFTYRHLQCRSDIGENPIIIESVLKLTSGRQREILARCREHMDSRRDKQPLGTASAGSFFKNPTGDSAGRLIDAAGLKGLRKGNAMVSDKHANFIVNTGQATPDDIVDLMKEVQQKVYLHSGVRLEPEVHIL